MSIEITTRGMITRCNLPSLNPAQSPLCHCLSLHSDERERPSTLKSSVNISGKLPRVRRAARVSSDYAV